VGSRWGSLSDEGCTEKNSYSINSKTSAGEALLNGLSLGEDAWTSPNAKSRLEQSINKLDMPAQVAMLRILTKCAVEKCG